MLETVMGSASSPFLISAAIIFGFTFGSFANVLIERVPSGESLLTRSRCNSCAVEIKPKDNIPVASYLMLRGQCRNCYAKISPRYILIEITSGALYLLPFLLFNRWELIVMWLILATIGLPLLVIDITHHRLPDPLTASLFLSELIAIIAFSVGGLHANRLIPSLLGALALSAFYLLVAIISRGGMGMGDVKLALSIGLISGFFNARLIIETTFIGFALGSIIGVALMVTGKASRKTAIPFGPFMIVAQFASLALLGKQYL